MILYAAAFYVLYPTSYLLYIYTRVVEVVDTHARRERQSFFLKNNIIMITTGTIFYTCIWIQRERVYICKNMYCTVYTKSIYTLSVSVYKLGDNFYSFSVHFSYLL